MRLEQYKIQTTDEEDIAPEETLADGLSGHSVVEVPISRGVLRLFLACFAIIFAIFLFQAFRLQVIQGSAHARLADQSRLNAYSIPALRGGIFDTHGTPLVENVPVFDLVAVRAELPPEDPLIAQSKNQAVFVVERDISKEDAIRYQATRPPGLYVVPYAKRHYVSGSAFAHVLGYTANITAEELKERALLYSLNDRIGRLGIEASYETQLHGEPASVMLDATIARQYEGFAGDSLTLTIDKNIQEQLQKSMETVFRASGVRRGAAVVQNVHTGAVLGMVSMPTFDPNLFEGVTKEEDQNKLRAILQDFNKPLFNRAISGLYAPGSTIKPLYALMGLKEKNVKPSTTIYADGGITIQSENDASVVYTYRDWKVHGLTDIRKAIAWSVDVYFYALGGGYGDIRGVGIDVIEKYLRMFLADRKAGVDLPFEAAGFVPSKKWKKEKRGEAWYAGDTYNISIGQGDLLVTPLWINTYISAVANGGNIWKPYLVKEIKDSQTGTIEHIEPELRTTVSFDQSTWNVVREGMRQTITDGTAQMLKDLPKPVAAKTGTAQVTGRGLNSLFTVYGPYDNPEIAVTILIEEIPQSQSLAVQVAKNFLMWYFQRDDKIF